MSFLELKIICQKQNLIITTKFSQRPSIIKKYPNLVTKIDYKILVEIKSFSKKLNIHWEIVENSAQTGGFPINDNVTAFVIIIHFQLFFFFQYLH